jgi:ATP-binding cassette subfamily D (ALD) protein 4
VTYTILTYQSLGWQGPLACYGYFVFGSIVNKILISPIVSLWFTQEAREGNYRFSQISLRTNVESIALFDGQEREKEINNQHLNDVIENRWKIAYRNFMLNCMFYIYISYKHVLTFNSLIVHTNLFGYTGAILSLFIIAFATFVLKNYMRKDESPSDLIARISMDSYYVISLVWGFTQFIQLATEISEMAGYTARIGDMREAMEEIEQSNKNVQLANQTQESDSIQFNDVTIHTPTTSDNEVTKCLVQGLNFKISKGDHLLIQGPSGCGKSSILRILGGLWPYTSGIVNRPSKKQLMFIPQDPYILVGLTTLRDQITYPHSQKTKDERDSTQSELLEALQKAKLEYILKSVGESAAAALDEPCNWSEILSPGEKQRLALTRVFYNEPKFVVLDECTSAVDIDVEEIVYENIRRIPDVTILSVGHRPSLKQFHNYSLRLDGKGGWSFGSI